jgi:histidinol-phosphate aminotransferase
MAALRKSQDALDDIIPYDPKYLPARILLSANENPESLPAVVEEEILAGLKGFAFNRYPDPLANELRDLIAAANGLARENVLVGNAGDELLFDFALAWGGSGRTLLNVVPTFSVYAANAALTGTTVVEVPRKKDYTLDEEAILARVAEGDIDQVVITSPNNPTGDMASEDFLVKLLAATDALVMLDEAYIEFADKSLVHLIAEHENLLILRTFSKAYSCAGVRLGYILAQPSVITEFIKVRQPYSVDAVSQLIGRAVMHHLDAFQSRIEAIKAQRELVFAELAAMPGVLDVYPSEANFLLVRIPDAGAVWERLYERGILVRDFSRSKGLEDCLRLTIGLPYENRALLDALKEILA